MSKKKKAGSVKYLVTRYGRFELLAETGRYYVTENGNFRKMNPSVLRVETETAVEAAETAAEASAE